MWLIIAATYDAQKMDIIWKLSKWLIQIFFLLTLTIYRDFPSAQRVEASEKIKAQ